METIRNDIVGWGADARPEDRPGVPMETPPSPKGSAHWSQPVAQPRSRVGRELEMHPLRSELTPVYGTAQPPKALSGVMRRAAYRIPDHHAQKWLLLMAADQVDVMESAVADLVRRSPVAFVAAVAGVIGAATMGGVLLARRRRTLGARMWRRLSLR